MCFCNHYSAKIRKKHKKYTIFEKKHQNSLAGSVEVRTFALANKGTPLHTSRGRLFLRFDI